MVTLDKIKKDTKNGLVITKYLNGKMRTKINYINGKIDGLYEE